MSLRYTSFYVTRDKQLLEAIELEDKVSKIEFKKIRDWISDSFGDLWDTFEDLISIEAPIELAELWPYIIEVAQRLLGIG